MPLTPELSSTHAPAHLGTGARVGCDLHPVADVSASIARFGARYLSRVFTAAELAQCTGATRDERLAARFAAKEAVFKVLRPARDIAVPWSSIEIVTDADGRPAVTLTGRAAALASRQGIEAIDVSMSHDAGVALAVAAAAPASPRTPVISEGIPA